MNYYKQGDAANADKIKAAFEKLGYDTTGWKFNVEGGFYYTTERKRIDLACGNFLFNLIKTHPDYQELELPVEHNFKFKVGDWIVQNDNGTVSQITKVINDTDEYGEYRAYEHTNGYFAACFENEYHLWTIQDAKDGDVLAVEDKNFTTPFVAIYKERGLDFFNSHCFIGFDGNFYEGEEGHTIENVHPATKEQRDILFKKMREAGYQWNSDKKELRKIQPHYDIANFYAGMPVLVRNENDKKWCYLLYSHYDSTYEDGLCFNAGSVEWRQCIPFEDNEHLLGTTDMPSEEYINW